MQSFGIRCADFRRRREQDEAAQRGVPRARIALAWLLSKPVVTAPIAGATAREHLDDAIAALDLALSADEVAVLEAPLPATSDGWLLITW